MKATVTFTCYYSYNVEGQTEDACIDKAYERYRFEKVKPIYDEVDIYVYDHEEEEDLEVYEYNDEENEEEGSERNNND